MSYADDFRAAAEEERQAWERVQSVAHVTVAEAQFIRTALTTPDRLLPFLTYVEQLERVAEAARDVDRAFSLDGSGDREREAAWSHLHRTLAALDQGGTANG